METSRNKVTRRDLLKKSLKTAGYVVPAMMFLSMGSLSAWAKSYRNGKPKHDPHQKPGRKPRRGHRRHR